MCVKKTRTSTESGGILIRYSIATMLPYAQHQQHQQHSTTLDKNTVKINARSPPFGPLLANSLPCFPTHTGLSHWPEINGALGGHHHGDDNPRQLLNCRGHCNIAYSAFLDIVIGFLRYLDISFEFKSEGSTSVDRPAKARNSCALLSAG